MQVLLVISIIVITVVFLLLIEGVRRVGGMPPDLFNYSRDMRRLAKKERPLKVDGERILLGTSGRKEIFLPVNVNHVYVCGTTGSGKTVALANFMKAGVDNHFPLLIIDGKGDTGAGSILEIVKALKGDRKLYVVDLNNPKSSDRYNPFCQTSPTVIKDMLMNMTHWSEEHYKLNTERYLQRVINLLFLANIPMSFREIIRYIGTDEFLSLSTRLVKEKRLSKEEHLQNAQIAKNSGTIAESAIARFATIMEGDLGQIFADDGIDVYTALAEGAIILFVLNPLLYPEVSPLIGNLIMIDSKKAVSKLYKAQKGRILFLFDEINVYASKTFLDLVNKSRSAGVTCILASQSLSDLESNEDTAFKEQVIENCNNYLILRQNSPSNAEEWANIVGTKPTMEVTYQLKRENIVTADTGLGSLKKTREYIIHPDDIKNMERGQCFLVSKDLKLRTQLNILKPF